MEELYKTIKSYKKGDINEIITILDIFDPLLNKFQRNSCYEDMKSELSLYMFNILNKIPLEKFHIKHDQDKYIISYIHKSLKNKYIYLNKYNQNIYTTEIESKDHLLNNHYRSLDTSLIEIEDMIKNLTTKEQSVINKIYIQSLKESEIAKELKISRQAVHKTHKRALSKLKIENKKYI